MVTRSGLRPPVTGVFVRCDVHVNRRCDASLWHVPSPYPVGEAVPFHKPFTKRPQQ
jgi:hypothetical protein